MKENAVTITAIIAGLGAMSGFLIKMAGHAKKVGQQAKQAGEGALHKVGERVKNRMNSKKLGNGETAKDSKEEKKDAKAKEEKSEKQDAEESSDEESK